MINRRLLQTAQACKRATSAGFVAAALLAGTQSSAHATAAPFTVNDRTGDHKSDITVWRPGTGTWFWQDSTTGVTSQQNWGLAGDVPVAADYSYGIAPDGKSDLTVWRPSNATWYWIDSQTGTNYSMQWGFQGDIPVSGDFDGDGKSDLAVWRHFKVGSQMDGFWHVIRSSTWTVTTQQWGLQGDIPVPCDYDGDAKTDFAVFRPSNATWYVINSSTGASWSEQWGQTGDVPVPGDYDNDGKCDVTYWRPSTGNWSIGWSSSWTFTTIQWGLAGDRPAPTDHDGDGKTDLIVWRPSTGTWWGINSTNGTTWNTTFGTGGVNGGGIASDVALPNYPGAKTQLASVLVGQAQSNWCWAATSQIAAAYYNVPISQCAEANVNTGRTDCCTNSASASDTTKCNQGGWWTLTSHGFTLTDLWNSSLSFAQLQTEFQQNRPVPFAWAWTGGGGHAMVAINAWVTTNGTQWVTKNDPWPPTTGTQDDLLYSSWVSVTNSHTHWRDSYNIIRTN